MIVTKHTVLCFFLAAVPSESFLYHHMIPILSQEVFEVCHDGNKFLRFPLYLRLREQLLASTQNPGMDMEFERERTTVILYNKPSNVITSHSKIDAAPTSPENGKEILRTTVYEEIQSMTGYVGGGSKHGINLKDGNISFESATGIRSKWHAIGRLDVNTTGLLLLTNDGGLVHHATNPTSESHKDSGVITKTYEALIMGHHDDESSPALKQIRTIGVDIGAKYGGWTKPSQNLKVLNHPTPKSTLVSITIAEGKNRQVRRMFHGVHSGVMKLHRSRIGQKLTLGNLAEGEWRILSEAEVLESLNWNTRTLDTIYQQKGRNRKKKVKSYKH